MTLALARTLALTLALPLFAATTAPYLVKDLPGPIEARGSLGSLWVTVGNTSWFTADSGDGLGLQVWRTDGTESGTVRVTSVVTTGLHAETFVGAINGHILYGGHDGFTNALLSLDVSGGAPETLAQGRFGERGILYQGALYVAGTAREDGGADKGTELFRTDGTVEGTTFADLNPGAASSMSPDSLALAGDWIVFAGQTAAGKGIYRTDGTVAGTSLLLALPAGFEPHEADLTQFGDRAVFVFNNAGFNNDQLWITDGTPDGTQPFVERMSGFSARAVLDGRLIFVMEKTTGRITMWTSDGTVAGTQQLNDHSSTANVGIVGIAGAVVGERFFFFGLDPQTGQPALFTTHALPGTTQKVIDLEVVPTGGTAWNGRFYWVNEDAAHGREWWVSDGTAAGTRIVADISLGSRDGAIFDESLVRADGLLIGGNGPFGHEPWIISGSPPRARELKNIAVDTPKPGSNPEELRAVGAQLFFLADAPGYRVVGKSDGRATTTELITPTDEWWFAETFASGSRYYLQSGSTLISTDGSPSGTEVLSRSVLSAVAFHRGVVYAELGDQTMRFSDGTVAGTSIIQPLPGFVFANWSLFSANGLVWFTNGSALAVSDGFSPMRRIQPASGTIGSIREVVEGPDATYFVDESIEGKRLWRTDGTNAGTRIVTTFAQLPTNFVATGDKLFFTQGSVLWSTGGAEGNTVPLGAPGVSSSCGGVAMLGNVLYWSARQNNGTAVVWKSDGTPGGTVEVASFPASPQGCVSMAALDGQVYFRGYDAEHGTELWVTNGTTPGTHLVADLNPGSAGSDPQELTVAGAHLFFTADTAGRGRELWAIEQLTRRRAVGHP